jgi:hypothetical protein
MEVWSAESEGGASGGGGGGGGEGEIEKAKWGKQRVTTQVMLNLDPGTEAGEAEEV